MEPDSEPCGCGGMRFKLVVEGDDGIFYARWECDDCGVQEGIELNFDPEHAPKTADEWLEYGFELC